MGIICSWSTNHAEVATCGCKVAVSGYEVAVAQLGVAVSGCEVAVTQLRVAVTQFGSCCWLLQVAAGCCDPKRKLLSMFPYMVVAVNQAADRLLPKADY